MACKINVNKYTMHTGYTPLIPVLYVIRGVGVCKQLRVHLSVNTYNVCVSEHTQNMQYIITYPIYMQYYPLVCTPLSLYMLPGDVYIYSTCCVSIHLAMHCIVYILGNLLCLVFVHNICSRLLMERCLCKVSLPQYIA